MKTRTLIGGEADGHVVNIPDHVKEYVVPVLPKITWTSPFDINDPVYFEQHRYIEYKYVYHPPVGTYSAFPVRESFLVYDGLSKSEAAKRIEQVMMDNLFDGNTPPPVHPFLDYQGVKNHSDQLLGLKKLVPNLNILSNIRCPLRSCGQYFGTLSSTIVHVNDRHKWSFEKIADWLDTLDVDLSVVEE